MTTVIDTLYWRILLDEERREWRGDEQWRALTVRKKIPEKKNPNNKI
jgi:hypothetical protein